MTAYEDFLARKITTGPRSGMEPRALPASMKPHQADATAFSLRCGRAGLYLDTGLGKTFCELEFSRQVVEAVNGPALILTPLAVAKQIEREAAKFGIEARVIREQSEARNGINICNYDRLDRLDPSAFSAGVLDESGILKSFTGSTSRALRDAFSRHRFRLSATATPAADFPLAQWQEWASPVWMTVDQSNVLNVKLAREAKDERHLCPLQLDVIQRAVVMWSNLGDTVFSPFMGIGSEGYVALREGRRFIGTELKETYFRTAVQNMASIDRQQILFSGEAC